MVTLVAEKLAEFFKNETRTFHLQINNASTRLSLVPRTIALVLLPLSLSISLSVEPSAAIPNKFTDYVSSVSFQGGIRTNTTVCLGKIACHLNPQVNILLTKPIFLSESSICLSAVVLYSACPLLLGTNSNYSIVSVLLVSSLWAQNLVSWSSVVR